MAGNMTHGYDLIMEMSEDTLNAFLAVMEPQENEEEIGRLGPVQFILNPPTARFASELMPNGIRLTIPVTINLLNSGRGASAEVSLTVPIITYTNPEGMIYPAVDFRECTVEVESLEFSGGGAAEPELRERLSGVVQNMLREQVGFYEIPIEITSDRFTIYALEVRIIDNTCLVIMIAFSEEGVGEAGEFTECHLPASGAAVFISNQWISRSLIAPALMERFNISEEVDEVFTITTTGMSLQHAVNLDHLNDRSIVDHITLDTMTVVFSAGQIDITGSISVTGSGFSGNGSISGRVFINSVDGNISMRTEIDEPEIEIHAEWWMHLLHVIGLILLPIVGTIICTILHRAIREMEESLGQISEEDFLELPIEIGSIEIDDLLLSGEYVLPPIPEFNYEVRITGDMLVTDYEIGSSRSWSTAGVFVIIVDHDLTHEGDFAASTSYLCYPLQNIQWCLAGMPLDAEGSVTINETPVEYEVNGLSCKLKTGSGATLDTELSISLVDSRGISVFDAINLRVEGQRTLFTADGVELLQGPAALGLYFFEKSATNIFMMESPDDPRVSASYSRSYVSLVDTVVEALDTGMDLRISLKDFRPH